MNSLLLTRRAIYKSVQIAWQHVYRKYSGANYAVGSEVLYGRVRHVPFRVQKYVIESDCCVLFDFSNIASLTFVTLW